MAARKKTTTTKKAVTKKAASTKSAPKPVKAKTTAKAPAKQATKTAATKPAEPAKKSTVAAKPTVKKPTATKHSGPVKQPVLPKTERTEVETKAAAKVAQPVDATTPKAIELSPEERQEWITQAAYFIAERDHFRGDHERYWLEAEAEVDARLRGEVVDA